MSTIQIRNVPQDLSRKLKARAAAEGRSLSDYLLQEIARIADRPTQQEILERISARGRLEVPAASEILAEGRGKRR